jgi:hypothetical protein
MRAESRLRALVLPALIASQLLGGCAAVPFLVSGAGDINFSSTTAYRSFSFSSPLVHAAALQALERMQITMLRDKQKGAKIEIKCRTKHLTIYIVLIPITPALTKASVNAKKHWVMKDQTVAAEILVQIGKILEYADSSTPPMSR